MKNTTKKKTVCELMEEVYTKLREIASSSREMETLLRQIKEGVPADSMGMPSSALFKRSVDERLLADVFCDVYQKFFGAFATEKLEGRFNKRVDLIAYFFIIVERYRLGNSEFNDRGKKPFYEFCKNSVLADDFKVTSATLYNRLTKTMDSFRRNLMQESLKSNFKRECWRGDIFLKDFKRVEKIFNETLFLKRKR